MEIKAKRSSYGEYGNVRRGEVITVDDRMGKALLQKGNFVVYDAKAEAKAEAEREAEQQARRQETDAAGRAAEQERAAAEDALAAELETLRSELADKTTRIADLEKQLGAKTASLVDAEKQVTDLSGLVAALSKSEPGEEAPAGTKGKK
jgi:flagellar motility protein MotE (MotC chaperone)